MGRLCVHAAHRLSGIIGADSGSTYNSGVAPGVDLVSLWVFDDNGSLAFSANAFDEVEVHGINGGNNTSVEEIVDYLFTLVGDWN